MTTTPLTNNLNHSSRLLHHSKNPTSKSPNTVVYSTHHRRKTSTYCHDRSEHCHLIHIRWCAQHPSHTILYTSRSIQYDHPADDDANDGVPTDDDKLGDGLPLGNNSSGDGIPTDGDGISKAASILSHLFDDIYSRYGTVPVDESAQDDCNTSPIEGVPEHLYQIIIMAMADSW